MAEPLLHRLPSKHRYDKRYRVRGHDHLVVEAQYSDPDHGRPELTCWMVIDTRFTVLDRYRRWIVFAALTLAEVRSWLRAGGAALWDPEKRKTDRDWKPVPEGWDFDGEQAVAPKRAPRRPAPRPAKKAQKPEVEPSDCPPSLEGKKYAVVPGWVTSVNDGQRHWIGFGALTWLYGVKPSECIRVDNEHEQGWNDEMRAHLIWLGPQRRHEDYKSMKEELAKGEDAFRLTEP